MSTIISSIDLPTKPKVQFDLGNGGCIRADEDIAPIIGSVVRDLRNDSEIFHEKLMSLGVKSYRCNDGWVNREDRVIIQRKGEWQIGFYFYGTSDIKEGDLVAIGNVRDGAMVVKVIECREFYDDYAIGIRYSDEVSFVVNGIYEGEEVESKYKPPYPIYENESNSTAEPHIRRLVKRWLKHTS